MLAEQLTAEALEYAKRIAFSMSQDPEVESIAGFAALSALRSYRDDAGTTLKQWIAVCVKRGVWEYWRREAKRRSEFKKEVWWERVAETPPIDSEPIAPTLDWVFLVEYYLEKHPKDVIAKLHNTTVYQVNLILEQALERLKRRTDCG